MGEGVHGVGRRRRTQSERLLRRPGERRVIALGIVF
jgi:hypothetical protein